MEAKERIVNKAHELFMRFGIRSVSMDEVANHLGMSKKTIYQFYTDKDALVADAIDMEICGQEAECLLQKKESENAIQEVFLAMDMVLDMLSTMNPTLVCDLEKYHPEAYKKYTDYKNKFLYAVVRDNLQWGIRDGLYRPDINTDIITRFRLASMFMIFNPELFATGKHSLSQVVSEITDNFLYGLVTSRGLRLVHKYKQQRQKKIAL
ncbi:MAG TPA: TetR/AcrR family transcriptional regulator [Sediminibacterium sp.]|nr:TetR/AcrR family transcriptional regulator [Sediminibacterium sp.]